MEMFSFQEERKPQDQVKNPRPTTNPAEIGQGHIGDILALQIT